MLSKACIVGIYQRKLEYIAQQGVDLLTVVPPSWRDERGEQKLERVYTEGYMLHVTPIRFNGNFHLHYYPALPAILRDFKPDVVHIDEEPYNLATWHALYHARRQGAKTLFFTWQNINRRYPAPFRWGESWVMRSSDAAIAGTDSAAEVLLAKGYAGPVVTIPQFGTDPGLFQPTPRAPRRPFTIGYVGRFVSEKGVLLLLQAASQLQGDWRLHLVGSGPQRPLLESTSAALGIAGRVTFTEWVASTEMPSLYHQFDALALPSLTRENWKEQFGRVLVEAMASGVPVIGSDSGAIPGVIADAGLILPEGDVPALTAALQRLLNDAALRQSLAQRGRDHVLAHFTHARIAQATVEVYRSLMA